MNTPTEIKKKATQHYKDFISSVLKRKTFFPLEIKGDKGTATMPLEELYPALKQLIDGSKEKLGYGYTLTFKAVNTQHAGVVSIPDRIYFEDAQDYLMFIEKEEEFLAFRRLMTQTRKKLPVLLKWLAKHPMKGIKYLAVWNDLLKVGQYFMKNPKPDRYARTLPIDVSPRFVEHHQNILKELLDFILPDTSVNTTTTSFEQRFGLKYDEPTIRFRCLSKRVIKHLPGYLSDIRLQFSQFNQLEVNAAHIFIVEEKATFLAFPNLPSSLVIWNNGFPLNMLNEIAWLKQKELIYWGNINLSGFQTLSKLRQYFPTIVPLLMDRKTFRAYSKFATTRKTIKVAYLEGLNSEEQVLLEVLNNLITQNNLNQTYIRHRDLLLGLRKITF